MSRAIEPEVMEGEVVQGGMALGAHHQSGTALAPASAGGVMALLERAVEIGVTVEMMGQLMDLQERVTRQTARAAFFEALAGFQEECPDIPKSKTAEITTKSGARFGYTYAPLDAIARAIRPVLRRFGLSYSFEVEPGNGVLTIVCVLRHVLGHEERSSFPVPIDTGARMSPAQANGAALTYGKRMALISVLGLTTTDEDTDAAQRQPRTVATASKEDLANIEALLDEVQQDRQKFLKYLGIDRLEQLPASTVPIAIRTLENKRKGGGA